MCFLFISICLVYFAISFWDHFNFVIYFIEIYLVPQPGIKPLNPTLAVPS